MEIEFISANEDAAKTIADLRHMIWCTTYHGIYSDEKIVSCNCNSHNYPAQEFYKAMGGIIIKRDEGHADKYDDQITFEFTVRE